MHVNVAMQRNQLIHVHIKKRGIKSLQKAKSLCDQGQHTKNLEENESEGELTGKRVTKPTKRFLDSDSEEEHDVSKKKKTRHTDIPIPVDLKNNVY
jgi:hypothetical protein